MRYLILCIAALLLLTACNDPARRNRPIGDDTPTATYLPAQGIPMTDQGPGDYMTADQSMITRWATEPTPLPTMPALIVATSTEAPTADLRAGTPPPTVYCVNFCNGTPLPTQVQP